MAEFEPRDKVPPVRLTGPEKPVFAPDSAKVLNPDFARVLAPEIADSIVAFPAEASTVMGDEIVPRVTSVSTEPERVSCVKVLAPVPMPRSKTGLAPAEPDNFTEPAKVPPAPSINLPALMVVRPE